MNCTTNLISTWNWDAFSAISNTILVFALVSITWWYADNMKKQTEIMKIDRDVREIENLVAPLNINIDNNKIFINGDVDYGNGRGEGVKEYFIFWDNIKRNKYLGSPELRSAITNYLKIKTDNDGDRTRTESYVKAETELFEAIKKRNSELENIYSNSR